MGPSVWVIIIAAFGENWEKPFAAFKTEKAAEDWIHDHVAHVHQDAYEVHQVPLMDEPAPPSASLSEFGAR